MAKKPIRVSQLNSYIAKLISADGVLSDVSVVGEVSNFKAHGSGHAYFSLIDDASRIDCFLGSGIFSGLDFELRDGTEVVAEGYVNVYEKGGRYSLAIRRISAGGQGGLAQDFDRLKKKLSEKGYFDEGRKKTLPEFPHLIAIVTSNTGAAVNDMLKIITSRNSVADINIFPTLVQGEGAAGMIASRIRQVNAEYPETDVMIIGRGGGSSEDLAAFNDEGLADAIFASKIPVVSAVGHETDFTIADFVADRRAETPTAAAVMVAPDTGELLEDVEALFSHMKSGVAGLVSRYELRIRANNIGALLGRLKSGVNERLTYLSSLRAKMHGAVLVKSRREAEIEALRAAIAGKTNLIVKRSAYGLEGQLAKLEALSPMRVLSRGYAIVEDANGRAVSSAGALAVGDETCLRFSDGQANAEINEVILGGGSK